MNDFGYKGVSSNALRDMLDDIQNDYAVDIEVEIQPTHTFDFNAQDALYHSELKRLLRQEGLPRGDNDLKNKFQDAVNKISLDSIQRGFIRAYSKTKKDLKIQVLFQIRLKAGMKMIFHQTKMSQMIST